MTPRPPVRTALVTLVAALASAHAAAQTPAAAPAPDWSVTANVGLYSEYLFRGIAQTAGKPALQGGFDVAHTGGFYAGTWGSNISWLEDFGAYNRSSLEWDFYAGFKKNFGDTDFYWDVGTLYYYYPGKKNPGVISADTWEIYAALGWKWASVKFSYNLDDYFGVRPTGRKTDGTYYIDASATYPVGERVGAPDSVVAETSFTRAPMLLGDLMAEPHAITVSESFDAPDSLIACANLGGIADELGGIVIGLTPQNDSGARWARSTTRRSSKRSSRRSAAATRASG